MLSRMRRQTRDPFLTVLTAAEFASPR